MKTSTKWAIGLGVVTVGIGATAWALASMGGDWLGGTGGTGEGGDTHDGKPSGDWDSSGGFGGGGVGGSIGGKDVTTAVMEKGVLPPGSILMTGPNLVGRGLAAAYFANKGVDFGFIDAAVLDEKVPEEGIEGDIENAQFTMVAISPQGDEAKWFVAPPRSSEQMGEALEEVAAFSGQPVA